MIMPRSFEDELRLARVASSAARAIQPPPPLTSPPPPPPPSPLSGTRPERAALEEFLQATVLPTEANVDDGSVVAFGQLMAESKPRRDKGGSLWR